MAASGRRVDVLRLGEDEGAGGQQPEVIACWDAAMSAAEAARHCNHAACVLLQHEFGIFPGRHGADVVDFVEALRVPLITVLHTVLVDPSADQRSIIEALAQRSARVVVLAPSAADRLNERYDVDPALVHVIPHGAELNLAPSRDDHVGPPVLLTWGLLGPGKGIEHAIRAVALLADRGLAVRFLIVGQTHPNVLAREGESYREGLVELSAELGVRHLVDFADGYRDWDEIHACIRSADLVVLPYDSREQAVSGVLVDAIASGKPIVATAFPHALDLVQGRCGIVVPHEQPAALADAIERIVTDRRLAEVCQAQARAEAARLAWPVVGAQYDALITSTLAERAGLDR
jgi:glycosyltransferase involved in cell wall biosynthesis